MFVFGIFFKTKFGGCEGCIHVMKINIMMNS